VYRTCRPVVAAVREGISVFDVDAVEPFAGDTHHVIYENSCLASHVTDQDHSRDLICLFALFMKEGEFEIELSSEGRSSA
jgi:hypothetical protein